MKLINPILITLHNTLHIKADNLEPVEVDSSCLDELSEIVYNKTKYQSKHPSINYYLLEGINISELSDRIEVRKIYVHKRESLNNFVYRAFLLPEKEDNRFIKDEDWTSISKNIMSNRLSESYTIEEFKEALNKTNICHYDKLEVLNNLKK